MVNESPNKFLVLTTREYILADAKQSFDKLSRADFSPMTCVMEMAKYGSRERAQVLYNHISQSGLEPAQRSHFSRREVFSPIVSHRSYNPRHIAQTLSLRDWTGVDPARISNSIVANLENPQQIWRHIVENDMSRAELHLLEVLFSFGGAVSEAELSRQWMLYRAHLGENGEARTYRRALAKMELTFVQSFRNRSGELRVGYHSPSVDDFLRHYLAEDAQLLRRLLESASWFEQVYALFSTATGSDAEALRVRLDEEAETLERSVLRTFDAPGLREQAGSRILNALRIAHHIDSAEIANSLTIHIREKEWQDDYDDADDLIELIRQIHTSKFDEVSSMREVATQEILDYVTQDTSDWDNIQYSIHLIENLGDLAPDGYVGAFEEFLADRAQNEIRRYAEGYYSSSVSMNEVLEYASGFQDPDEVFPGYSEARAATEMREAQAHDSGPSVVARASNAHEELSADRDVMQLMSLLSETAEE